MGKDDIPLGNSGTQAFMYASVSLRGQGGVVGMQEGKKNGGPSEWQP